MYCTSPWTDLRKPGCCIEAVAADPTLVERVLASNDFLVGLLRNGREQCPPASSLPELTERALIGAASSVIGNRPSRARRTGSLPWNRSWPS